MSTPSSSHTCVAYKLGGCPRTACTPAEATSMSLRLPSIRRKRPSAMGLRQMLPVQTKRTLFTMNARQRTQNQPRIEQGQVNARRKKNDEARMTNDEGMTKPRMTKELR